MQIALANRDVHSMFFVMGTDIHLTYDNPGPFTFNAVNLSLKHKETIISARDRGILWIDDGGSLSLPPPVKVEYTAVTTTVTTPKSLKDVTANKTMLFNKLLKKRVPSIKLEVAELALIDMNLIMTLESTGRNRKTLMNFFNEILEDHAKQVSISVGTEDLSDILQNKMINQVGSTQISDVLESESKDIILNPEGEDLILAEDPE